ncbi:hypothetical protein AB1Y20_008169 [Prymnesium parvum]|uniref:UBX domain-containing protein n=1 Tax=Prymnesium parvum TaxID=97485 RepID=A0AB34IWF4_PRYPA
MHTPSAALHKSDLDSGGFAVRGFWKAGGVEAVAMDIDFDVAARKFEKEQLARRKKEEQKRTQLAAERARTQALQRRWAQEAERRRLDEARRAEEAAREREADLERNRGVAYSARLRAELSLAGEMKGIVRRADKLTLPPSAQLALMEQQATKNGQLFFELRGADGARTHGSILDFTAREGTVGLPPDVMRCLSLPAEGSPAEVSVRYRFLKKGTSAKVQPELSAFQADVSDIKALLESELMLRTTLTEGDRIIVRSGEESYVLRVVELLPEPAVSLIDTDLEVDLLPSVQAEEAAAAEEEARRRLEEMRRQAAEQQRLEEEAAAAAAATEAQRAAEEAAAKLSRRERRRELACEQLRQLGGAAEESRGSAVSVAIRCPDGSRCTATFRTADPLAALFLLVEAQWKEADGAELLPEVFELASSFPRRVFNRVDGVSLAESGLTAAQEALFVQLPAVS